MQFVTASYVGKAEHVGVRVRKLRQAQDRSRKWLAEVWGCTVASVSQIENGQRKLSLERADQLAEALGVSLDRIVKGARTGKAA
jgi:transcriptional regulator with XRE-family HTH domain